MQKDINGNVEKLFIHQAGEFANSINTLIKSKIKKDVCDELKNNASLREFLEHNMNMLITSSYKFVYVLYRDKKGNYRYLLDGSKKDKGEFGQKLNVDKKVWNEVYKTQKDKIVNQTNLETLWITYLKPIITQDHVDAVIAIDFSNKLPKKVSSAILPVNKIFHYIFLAIFVILLILLYQTILGIKTKRESFTDSLTQIYNRTYLREFLSKINIEQYQILMFDIDHFKGINDSYGHKAGDFILQKMAKIIKNEIRDEDVFVRYGGEEFLVFLKKGELLDTGFKIAQRLNVKVATENFIYENKQIGVTISIGVNCNPHKFKNIHEAIKYADEMLYIAKRNGRDQVVKESSQKHSQVTEQFSINKIKDALENNKVLCYFQPIFSGDGKIITKYEALVRIKHQDKIITPNLFLDSIMHTNIYNDITKRVLEVVFSHIELHKKVISVNLNFSDITDNTIYGIIKSEIVKNKKFASYLIVELLENEKINHIELIEKRLKELKDYGIQIAIDDFGSGYSNYEIFKVLDIDIVKIDGSIIKDIDNSQTAYKIVKSIVVLAKELQLKIVAEYVHNEDVFNIVSKLGIDSLQGFYLSEPLEKI